MSDPPAAHPHDDSLEAAIHEAMMAAREGQPARSSIEVESPRALLAWRATDAYASRAAASSYGQAAPPDAGSDSDGMVDVTVFLEEDEVSPRYNNSALRKVVMGATIGLLLGLGGKGLYDCIRMIILRKLWACIPLVVLVPVALYFFTYAVVTAGLSVFLPIFSPVREARRNSTFFSAIKTNVPKGAKLPPIVVQMPVYKEPLHGVIDKTYFNVKLAVDDYVSKGGRAKFLVCDDGLQVISPDEAAARVAFYKQHGIAYVGRPPNGRRGVFKKASNLNYSLYISNMVTMICNDHGCDAITALGRLSETMDKEFLADGDVTIPDNTIILLIDADTKVPLTCMYDTMGEFITSPSLPYTQHLTAPFDEQNTNYWECYISFFTEAIYFVGIAISTSLGDTAPLVGHNAFLRWSSMKSISFVDDEERLKYWCESSVSEDFDLYMRLAAKGQFGRYVTYTGTDFQEGISLTYIDEVKKMRKFAYGTCELMFNPIARWWSDGFLAPQLRKYLVQGNIAWHQKASLMAYMSSYLAMAAGFPLTVIQGAMVVFANDIVDLFLVRSFYIMVTCAVCFAGLSLVSNTIVMIRYNPKNQKWWQIVWGNLKFVPAAFVYFNSILYPMTTACVDYFLGAKVVWGATVKETGEKQSRLSALATTLSAYRWQYVLFSLSLGVYSYAIYWKGITVVAGWGPIAYSAGHLIGPILLNPAIFTG